ncbi:MAG TPA: hypothetical protein VHY56_00195, partial [Candidatus Binataceae bacterium]|nr:hypothetical protein [Candidatus Binataceae bacterium]
MDLRAKLAIVFVGILVLPFLVVSIVQVDHGMGTMVEDLSDSGTLLADQTFEQIRTALAGATSSNQAGLESVLHNDSALAAFLSSSQAFGKGVVYARIDDLNGKPIASAESIGGKQDGALPMANLRAQVASWWPQTRIGALWNERTYEIRKQVKANDQPFALIRIGLSTALISAE